MGIVRHSSLCSSFVLHTDVGFSGAFGGFLASVVQTVAGKHSTDTGGKYKHHDVLNMQIQFLRPVLSADIELSVTPVSAAKNMSTVHVTLSQKGKDCLLGYVK